MLSADEVRELRVLQGRAYGRGGAVTDSEARRLGELEKRARLARDSAEPRIAPDSTTVPGSRSRVDAPTTVPVDDPEPSASDPVGAPAAAEVSTSSGPAPRASIAGTQADGGSGSEADGASGSDQSTDPARGGIGGILRAHVKAAVAASAVLLLVGIAAGWAIFGHHDDGVPLTAAQQERRIELQAAGDFDQGSVRVIGQDDDATVWYGTRQDGELACIVLEVGENSTDMCQPQDELASGYNSGVTLVDGEGDSGTQISASAVRAASGEIVAIIQRWPSGGDAWLSQFTGSERTRAEQLLDLGFEEYSFSVIGYVNDLPVWRGTRIEDGTSQDCRCCYTASAR